VHCFHLGPTYILLAVRKFKQYRKWKNRDSFWREQTMKKNETSSERNGQYISRQLQPNLENWFRLSWLANMVVIGLQKPYAKLESGANLVMYDVYWLDM
jgi:hypothetical protein